MKLFNYLPVLFISAALFTSCDDKKDDAAAADVKTEETTTTTVVKRAGEGTRTVITADKLPAPVVTTFQAKITKPEGVEWVVYDPVEADNWDMQKDYYFVTYRSNNIPYEAWLSPEGELIKAEPKIFLENSGDLPTEVVRSIMEKYPGHTIVEIEKENEDKTVNYEVQLKSPDGAKVKAKFAADGTVLKAK